MGLLGRTALVVGCLAAVAVAYLWLTASEDASSGPSGAAEDAGVAGRHSDREAGDDPAARAKTKNSATGPASGSDPVMIGAGDIADCAVTEDEATGGLIEAQLAHRPDAFVYNLGDNAYPDGKLSEFEDCYGPAWGRFLGRTYPALGNHEYEGAPESAAEGYFDYFVGRAAMTGDRGEGYYAYDVGPNWRAIVLNSNPKTPAALSPGCGADTDGAAQMDFLRRELADAGKKNVVAYFHHARFSDGPHGSTPACAESFFDLLYENKADLMLTAHNHIYERLTDIDASGNPVPDGIDQFVVGQGGRSHNAFAVSDPGRFPPPEGSVDARDNTRSGVLRLTLRANGYDWKYVGVPGGSFEDAGSEAVFR